MAVTLADQIFSIRLDKSSPVPVYAQIAEQLRRLLSRALIPANSELPSERLLCEAYGISRMTLRQALGVLEREGLLEARRGCGTFVSVQLENRQRFPDFPDEMPADASVFNRLLSFRIAKPSAAAREFFGIPAAERVYDIRRLRFAARGPAALESVQIPQAVCPNLDQFDVVHESFYCVLEEHYGLKLAESTEQISAIRPNRGQMRLLEAPASAALLMVCRRTRTTSGVPVLFTVTVQRGDHYAAVRPVSCKLSFNGSGAGLFNRGKQTSPAVPQHEPAADGS